MVNSTMAMFLPLILMFGFAMEAEQQTNSSGKRIARRTKEFTMDDLPKLAANISPDVMGSFFKFKLYLKIVFRILKAVETQHRVWVFQCFYLGSRSRSEPYQ
jgi:hypothetical protein